MIKPAPVTVTTASPLPAGMSGVDYPSQLLAATGGTGTYTWALTGGSLPTGLTLAKDGTLSGIPSATGSFTLTVTATDSADPNPQVALTETRMAGTNAQNYQVVRTWTTTDASGNRASATAWPLYTAVRRARSQFAAVPRGSDREVRAAARPRKFGTSGSSPLPDAILRASR